MNLFTSIKKVMVVVIAVSGRVLASIAGPPCDGPLPSLLPPDLHQPGGAVLQPLLRPPPLLPRAPLHLQGRHPGGTAQGGPGRCVHQGMECLLKLQTNV